MFLLHTHTHTHFIAVFIIYFILCFLIEAQAFNAFMTWIS